MMNAEEVTKNIQKLDEIESSIEQARDQAEVKLNLLSFKVTAM